MSINSIYHTLKSNPLVFVNGDKLKDRPVHLMDGFTMIGIHSEIIHEGFQSGCGIRWWHITFLDEFIVIQGISRFKVVLYDIAEEFSGSRRKYNLTKDQLKDVIHLLGSKGSSFKLLIPMCRRTHCIVAVERCHQSYSDIQLSTAE
ncbi:MAG: hypothetical protein AB7J40_00610 [Candidatus Altimarinota bacterium]